MPLIGTNNIIQKQVLSATNLVTTNPGTSFQEVSDAFRLSITPKFSNSMIFLEYLIPLNQTSTGHNNIFGFQAYRISGGSGAGDVSSAGASSGSRHQMAGGLARSQNGSDGNVASQVNFGQPPYTIASGNSDGNGYGNFEYAVPTGYYALCSKNVGLYGG